MKRMTSIALVCLTLTSACSKVKEFEKKTASMEETTKEMSTTTEDMKGTTTVMYQQIRSKETEDTRSKKFEELLKKENGMGTKFAAAAVYYKSFEFQLWNANVKYEDVHSRDELYLDATNEFVKRVTDIYDRINVKKISPIKSGKKHSNAMAFYALAGTMHMNHHFQESLAKKNGIRPVSFYDLVKRALLKNLNLKPRREYEDVLLIGIYREIMIELLKARVDILSALAVKDLTDKRNMSLGQKAKGLLFKMSFGKLGSIDLPETYDKANESTKLYIEKYLDGALSTRNFLREIGVSKNINKTLHSALAKIDFNEKNSAATKSDDACKKNTRRLINELLN